MSWALKSSRNIVQLSIWSELTQFRTSCLWDLAMYSLSVDMLCEWALAEWWPNDVASPKHGFIHCDTNPLTMAIVRCTQCQLLSARQCQLSSRTWHDVQHVLIQSSTRRILQFTTNGKGYVHSDYDKSELYALLILVSEKDKPIISCCWNRCSLGWKGSFHYKQENCQFLLYNNVRIPAWVIKFQAMECKRSLTRLISLSRPNSRKYSKLQSFPWASLNAMGYS